MYNELNDCKHMDCFICFGLLGETLATCFVLAYKLKNKFGRVNA